MRRFVYVLMLTAGCAGCATRATPSLAPTPFRPRTLPAIPDTISSQLGPVTVVWRDSLRDEQGRLLMGGFMPATRTIYLSSQVTNKIAQWQVLLHEICHVSLFDSGLRADGPIIDSICDVVATARVREMLSASYHP